MKEYMTAEELAILLLKNPKDIVCVTSSNFELGHSTVPMRKSDELYRFNGYLKDESFRDAFDGGSYNSKVVRHGEKGELKFVQL